MIHTRNGREHSMAATQQVRKVVHSRLEQAQRMEHEVGQWIRQNPLIGISLALLAGVGLGLLLKRQR